MRVGFNPHKDQQETNSEYFHQVVVPVYIPNFEGYFKDGLKILEICLQSIIKTSHDKTFLTIVNNGSCIEVKNYLDDLFAKNLIHELVHAQNIGKLNAILKAINGANFKLITIADADVLFLNNWQKATYEVFNTFTKAGVVCPTPSPRSLRIFTANIYWDLFFSKKLKFSKVKNPDALLNFARSVGDEKFYNQYQLNQYLTVNADNCKAVIGAGHFVSTYKKEVFQNLNITYSNYKLGGDSEGKILDQPVVTKGLWRLSTEDNFAYHLGNVHENWMDFKINELSKENNLFEFESYPVKQQSRISNFIINKVFSKFILNKKVFRKFIALKGLSKDAIENYL